jgi:hypothetical protein
VGARTLGARPADADCVEHVGAELETFGTGEAREDAIELRLELVRKVHVGHRTTHSTREVVMMTDQCLGELEAGELADPCHAMHDPLGFEHGEIAVNAARALAGGSEDDLVDGERPARRREHLDQIPPRARVAPVVVRETRGNGRVKIRSHRASIDVGESGSRS